MAFAFATHYNQMIYISRVSAFLFCLRKETPAKKRQTRGFTTRPRNAAPQYIVRGSQSVARHIRPQTRRSLNECGLVRLASQAVQPSQNIVAYRPWSVRYAPCFSPTSPRFIRHRRRFGDVARLSKKTFKHCGAAIGRLIVKTYELLVLVFQKCLRCYVVTVHH